MRFAYAELDSPSSIKFVVPLRATTTGSERTYWSSHAQSS